MSLTDCEKPTLSLLPRLTIYLVFSLLCFSSFGQYHNDEPKDSYKNSKNSKESKDVPPQEDKQNNPLSDDQKLLRDLRNQLLGDRKMLEQYFQKDFLDRMDQMFEDSMKQFGNNNFDDMFKSFQDGFHQGLGAGLNNQWLKEKEGMVLLIDGAVAKGGTFDLKVKEGQVTIKGSLEKNLGQLGKRVMSFNRSFPVPAGTDANRVRVENADDGIRVIFPWSEKQGKAGQGSSQKGPKKSPQGPKKTPLKKDSDDLVI